MGLFTSFYVGLDIGRYKVDGAKLKKDGKKVELISSLSIPYKKKVFDGENLIDESEILYALGMIKTSLKIDIEDVIISALFPDRILFRKIELPKMPEQQISNAAKFQIVKELSISAEEITVEVDTRQKDLNLFDVSAFVARNEDISKFNSLFFKSGLPFPDILDAGYFKFNYILKEVLFKGITFVAFEDISSTYLELFENGILIGVDNVIGGSEEISDDGQSVNSHYQELSDKIQRLSKMMLSRFSMSNMDADYFIFTSETEDYLDVWKSALSDFQMAKEVLAYREALNAEIKVPLGAYSLAMRGVTDNHKNKFLPKKGKKSKSL